MVVLQATREREDLSIIEPHDKFIQRELETGKFTLLVSLLEFYLYININSFQLNYL